MMGLEQKTGSDIVQGIFHFLEQDKLWITDMTSDKFSNFLNSDHRLTNKYRHKPFVIDATSTS